MVSANQTEPVLDIPQLHRGLYDDMIYKQDWDDVTQYRNEIKDLFLKAIVLPGIKIVKARVTTAREHIQKIEQLENDVRRCTAARALELLGESIKADVMPKTEEYYVKEGDLNRTRLDCVLGEMLRIWRDEMANALTRSSKESIKSFHKLVATIEKEQDQSCMKILSRANKKPIVSERDHLIQKLHDYEAKIKENDAQIKLLKVRLSHANKLKSAYEAIQKALEIDAKENPAANIIQRQIRVYLRRKRIREAILARNKAAVII